MSTLASRKRTISSQLPIQWATIRSTTIDILATILAISIMCLQLYYIYKQHEVIQAQKEKLQTLATFCPTLKLLNREIEARGSVEEEGKVRKCLYDLEEHVLLQENRKLPKDSKYLLKKD